MRMLFCEITWPSQHLVISLRSCSTRRLSRSEHRSELLFEITTSSTSTCIRMERRVPDSTSLRSSITEEDLEDARQRLLLHQEEDDTEYTTPLPPHQPARSQAQYGSVSTIQSSQATRPPKPKRYRLPFLILLVFDFGLIVFLSIICSVVGNTSHNLFFRSRLSICGLLWGTGHYAGVVCTPIILGHEDMTLTVFKKVFKAQCGRITWS